MQHTQRACANCGLVAGDKQGEATVKALREALTAKDAEIVRLTDQKELFLALTSVYTAVVAEHEAIIATLRDAAIGVMSSLAGAISLLERGGKKAAGSDKMFDIMLADYRKALEAARAAYLASAPKE